MLWGLSTPSKATCGIPSNASTRPSLSLLLRKIYLRQTIFPQRHFKSAELSFAHQLVHRGDERLHGGDAVDHRQITAQWMVRTSRAVTLERVTGSVARSACPPGSRSAGGSGPGRRRPAGLRHRPPASSASAHASKCAGVFLNTCIKANSSTRACSSPGSVFSNNVDRSEKAR